MSTGTGVATSIQRLCDDIMFIVRGTPVATRVSQIRARMDEPLRVAVAGRVKAGKSTLLNALVGERLASTDAGECTRIVSWYRRGHSYDVHAYLTNGYRQSLPFTRNNGKLEIELGNLTPGQIERLDVEWPSSNLATVTLIDTPGLVSLDDSVSVRTRDFLALEDDDRQSDADAVIYLMRHLHRRDAGFLESFYDPSLSNPSPVNAIAVLSRADEIGGGRADALESASRIAGRYASDPNLQALAVTVLPVAGLIAETGVTIQEHEAASLRVLATMNPGELEKMMLSVDRFVTSDASDLLVETRHELLQRFGIFGIRLTVEAIRTDQADSATELAELLIRVSGLQELRSLLASHFRARAQALKGRSALASLRVCAREIAIQNPAGARRMVSEIEKVESSIHAFAELRLVHLMLTGTLRLSTRERTELELLTGEGTAAERCGLPADASVSQIRDHVLNRIAHWRQRIASPLSTRDAVEAFEIVARSYEGIYAGLY